MKSRVTVYWLRRCLSLAWPLAFIENVGMKLMAQYLEGDKSFIPENKLIIVPTAIIDQSNVDAFWAELKARQGK